MYITISVIILVFKKTFSAGMLMAFTWINTILLSSLTSAVNSTHLLRKTGRCVLNTSVNFAFDFIHLPLVYTDYTFVVCL